MRAWRVDGRVSEGVEQATMDCIFGENGVNRVLALRPAI